jgi:hypothetical protein
MLLCPSFAESTRKSFVSLHQLIQRTNIQVAVDVQVVDHEFALGVLGVHLLDEAGQAVGEKPLPQLDILWHWWELAFQVEGTLSVVEGNVNEDNLTAHLDVPFLT